ncbi:unnamed protein product [Caenorhabditis auriculariae]|uniref:Uncharacterized protein n=1 Tax=Caenorhabditis auriculariae TaxID=2777116 RepID=A0A8S1HCL8_9PELO|nr:unnamed protein product [Caenorhabditis auriculariae]
MALMAQLARGESDDDTDDDVENNGVRRPTSTSPQPFLYIDEASPMIRRAVLTRQCASVEQQLHKEHKEPERGRKSEPFHLLKNYLPKPLRSLTASPGKGSRSETLHNLAALHALHVGEPRRMKKSLSEFVIGHERATGVVFDATRGSPGRSRTPSDGSLHIQVFGRPCSRNVEDDISRNDDAARLRPAYMKLIGCHIAQIKKRGREAVGQKPLLLLCFSADRPIRELQLLRLGGRAVCLLPLVVPLYRLAPLSGSITVTRDAYVSRDEPPERVGVVDTGGQPPQTGDGPADSARKSCWPETRAFRRLGRLPSQEHQRVESGDGGSPRNAVAWLLAVHSSGTVEPVHRQPQRRSEEGTTPTEGSEDVASHDAV